MYKFDCFLRSLLLEVLQYIKDLESRGGLPYESGGDARRLAYGCKFQILVSLRVFWAKHHYI